MSYVYSTEVELEEIAKVLRNYIRLPVSTGSIPGDFLEATIAHVRRAERLHTYDYVDVVDRELRTGWSIKSTKEQTPLTWKRAKISNKVELIEASRESKEGLQNLGDSLIDFCNSHAHQSMERFGLDDIGYARLILMKSGKARYFERIICSVDAPNIFDPQDFSWRWSEAKKTKGKEQLPALHGYHRSTGEKWWAWHGLSENQLHFSGERSWWPKDGLPHTKSFQLPSGTEKLSFETLAELLDSL